MDEQRQRKMQAIREAIEAGLKEAAQDRGRFNGDPINWGDLGCTLVRWWEDDDGDSGYSAVIEEAGPGCHRLLVFLYDYLAGRGLDRVEITTEW